MAVRLSPAQVRWLESPGDCSNIYTDRTYHALVMKGFVEIVETSHQGNGRSRFVITDAGRAALAASRPIPATGAGR